MTFAFWFYMIIGSLAFGACIQAYSIWLYRPGLPSLFYLGSGFLSLSIAFVVISLWRYGPPIAENILIINRAFFVAALFNFYVAMHVSLALQENRETFFAGRSRFWRRHIRINYTA